MKTITLKDNEYQLLMSILDEINEDRSNCGCNDPEDKEEALFSREERVAMQKSMWGDEFEDQLDEGEENDGFLFNCDYTQYIIDLIKNQAE